MIAIHQSLFKLITYLAAQPSLDRLAQFLVLDAFADHEPRGALISGFENDGHVCAKGSFGLDQEVVQGLQHLSVWDHAPAVDAIRQGSPIVLADASAVVARYPWLAQHGCLLRPTVAWPLSLGEERLGAIQMLFTSPIDEASLMQEFGFLTPVIALYLGLGSGIAALSNGHAVEPNGHKPSNDEPLTERQMTILKMLAQGMTNPQIAARIGFSDSTVRQETMVIYRHLGANGRRDASRIAQMRGLLSSAVTRSDSLPIPS